MKKKLCNDII